MYTKDKEEIIVVKLILKPIIVLIVSMIIVFLMGWQLVENTSIIDGSRLQKYAVSKSIKEAKKKASTKDEKDFYSSDEYKQLVTKSVSSSFDNSRGLAMALTLKEMLREKFIKYSAILFIMSLISTGYIKDLQNYGKTEYEDEN